MQSTGCPRLDQDLSAFHGLLTLQPASSEALASALRSASETVANADFDAYDVAAIRTRGQAALDDMLDLRVALRARIGGWLDQGLLTEEVIYALRGVFRDGRYATDMIGELIHDIGIRNLSGRPAKPVMTAFSGGPLHTLVNPAYGPDGNVSVRSGDVLLVRGMASNSAAIARIGDVDSQFSHVGIVHVPKSGPVSVVEALIEVGGTIKPLREALSDDLARAMLLRPKDPNLAEAAAALARAFIQRTLSGPLRPIPYDFSMELGHYEMLFCSKLVRLAFAGATDGRMQLPTFPTNLDMHNRHFFNQIGVTAQQTFAPADIEMEPAFDVVAEWRDFRNTALIRNQDLVMDMIFHWMETEDVRFEETAWIGLVSRVGRASSYLPQGIKSLFAPVVPSVPRHMPRSAVAEITMLHATCGQLVKVLTKEERRIRRERGRPMHPREAYHVLSSHWANRKRPIGYLRAPS